MGFRPGQFDRSRTGVLRSFCPAHAVASLPEISLDQLRSEGKMLILLDVDHTLVKWKQEEFSPEVLAWVAKAKEMGFHLCILSNTRHPERLGRLAEKLGIETFRGRFKPSTHMYEMALEHFGEKPENAVMIGDQIMTDVLGANRSGIDAIWVQKMEGPEFIGTKFNRMMELLVTSLLYRSLVTPSDAIDTNPNVPLLERTIVKQILKFCFVGGISFVIDLGIRFLLMNVIRLNGDLLSDEVGRSLTSRFPTIFQFASGPDKAFYPIAVFIAASVAMFNSFALNRSFTFRVQGNEGKGGQLARVYVVGYIGMALNILISSGLYNIIPGHRKISLIVSAVCAAFIVAAWNFVGQRYFAFRVHKSE
ncbi:MAG: YqeG family HAD IIIA-type phosphatase [Armatimonadetes bacterium]|nr:YqeG family HAD IIIA-type phosphatase [Armatimonadota bacterium]